VRLRSLRYETVPPARPFHDAGVFVATPVLLVLLYSHHCLTTEMYANRWVATSTRRNGPSVDINSPEMVERKVKALLNKLTIGRFDTVSDQIIAWANKSEREKDGRTLIQVIKLIFETATDEEMFSKTHARLCRKMMEQISPKVQDSGVKNAVGKPYAGGQLFLKYLFNRCQEGFERGWVAKEATTIIATSKLTEDQAATKLREKTKGGDGSGLCSDEYYAAAKAKRRGLGLIRFIGELFKLQMVTERIMHGCIKKLLGNVETPGDEEIESLCMLLTIVGSLLDTQKARAHLDMYFSRMKELMRNKNVNARMMFILQVSGTRVPSVPNRHRLLLSLRMSSNSANVDGLLEMLSVPLE
jgi:translation initiation factor 4G